MARDEDLVARFQEALGGLPGISETRMMGGTCFLLDGNMIGGTNRSKSTGEGRFMFRVGKENEAIAAARAEAVPMIHGGRRMGGFFFVAEEVCSDEVLGEWVALALSFVGTLPRKTR